MFQYEYNCNVNNPCSHERILRSSEGKASTGLESGRVRLTYLEKKKEKKRMVDQ